MTLDELVIKYTDELTAIKSILLITDTVSDIPIALAIDKTYKAIFKYTGWDTFNADYMSTLYSLSIAYYNNENINNNSAIGKRAVTQKTDGSRSRTYAKANIEIDADGLTQEVKAMLPLPKLRCL